MQYADRWIMTMPFKSLYLYGVWGSGKTTFAFALIYCIMKNLKKGFYFWPRYFSGKQLGNKMLEAMKSQEGDEWQLNDFSTMDLLFIDDIDKAQTTDRFKSQLFEVINNRYVNNLPTIITSNLEAENEQLSSVFDGSVISRMSDTKKWQAIGFPKKDLRKMIPLEF
jgi:DNA replication protein DnaC